MFLWFLRCLHHKKKTRGTVQIQQKYFQIIPNDSKTVWACLFTQTFEHLFNIFKDNIWHRKQLHYSYIEAVLEHFKLSKCNGCKNQGSRSRKESPAVIFVSTSFHASTRLAKRVHENRSATTGTVLFTQISAVVCSMIFDVDGDYVENPKTVIL